MRKYLLLIFYVVVCTLTGREFHPFSQFPMYSSFPNYSYTFFLKNERGELVPFHNYFTGKTSGTIAHNYSTFFNYHDYMSGFGQETPAHLKEAGKDLMGMLLQAKNTNAFNFDTLSLYRRFYYLNSDTITYRDDLMYAQNIKP